MGSHSRTQRHGRSGQSAADDAFFAEHGWGRVPRLVQWMTTLRCPLSCEHCLAADDGSDDMPLSDAAGLIEQVAEMGVDEFLLTGGEPLARADLPEIIGVLRANGVRWSLNTAMRPDRRTRAAIEQWPPGFVAVSIDGPEAVHDAFRGRRGTFRDAMESIAWFAELVPAVAAGTTVTARNIEHLPQTFGLVMESGATQWGLHLTVPEGRAAGRNDLLLSRPQLRRLLRFAASKRNHFPVTMADEIGYCGFWEPLVRDEPFFCGAGRAGCVVLPDGEVVPCTTLDRTTSAGNLRRRPLRHIWETGFGELRARQPDGQCRSCRYAVACQGGCWLQRRHGTQCFRTVWHVPAALTAAGLAVCIGLGAPGAAVADEPPPAAEQREPMSDEEAAKMQVLQRSIIRWYAWQIPGRIRDAGPDRVLADLREALPEDPGAAYFIEFAKGDRPDEIADRAKGIEAAFKTEQRSLCLVGLAWRDLTEWCLDGPPPPERTDAERQALRESTALIAETAETWRTEIFADKLDPFLRRPVQYRHFFMSKAGPTPLQRAEGEVARSRWGGGRDITEQFLAEHPYAEPMKLEYTLAEETGLRCIRSGETIDADGVLRVFDLLLVPEAGPGEPVTLTFAFAGGHTMEVRLPAGTELTYGDVLRLAHEQNPRRYEDGFFWRQMIHILRPSPFALPELRRRAREFRATPENADKPLPSGISWPLAQLYLF